MRIELVTKRGIFRTRWWWRIRASNGRIIANSETYSSHAKARQTVDELVSAAHRGLTVMEVNA